MSIGVRFLQPKNHFTLDTCENVAGADEQLWILLCRADTSVAVPTGVVGCWWPIRGTATLCTAEYALALENREAYLSDAQRAHELFMGGSSFALGLVAAPATWNSLLAARSRRADEIETAIAPALHRLTPSFRRELLQVVRIAQQPPQACDVRCVFPVMSVLQRLQAGFAPLIERCPGRNMSQRRSVFLRLQRVRNLLSFSTDSELDMRQVAAAANYSLWRFIRVFASVFGETPYAYVSRCRIDRARRMLISGGAAVSDVAAAVGYETSVALSRAILRHFGVPASQLRQKAHAEDSQLSELSRRIAPMKRVPFNLECVKVARLLKSGSSTQLAHVAMKPSLLARVESVYADVPDALLARMERLLTEREQLKEMISTLLQRVA
jgi:AraC family transcriptional regulator